MSSETSNPDTRANRMEWLTVVLFLLALATPLCCQVLRIDLKATGGAEMRVAAPFPELKGGLGGVQAFPRDFDAWFSDHFGLRNALIRLHSSIVYFGLRSSPAAKIIVGRDGWLYLNAAAERDGADSIADYRGHRPLTPAQLEYWRWYFQDEHDALARRGIKFLMALVPAKEAIHPEHLPGWMTRFGPQTALEQMTAHLKGRAAFEWVDTTAALREGRKRERVFLLTDSHWNRYGGYCGYRAILGALTNQFPAVTLPPDSAFDLGYWEIPGGDLARLMALHSVLAETNVIMTPKTPPRANPVQHGGRDLPDLLATLPDTNLPRAVVFRDSFTQDLIPYLSEHFERVVYTWARVGVDDRLIKEEQPDVVLHILSDRLLRMGLRYPPEWRDECARDRFDRSATNVMLTAANLTVTDASRPLEVGSLAGDPARFLPVVRMDLTSPQRGEVRLAWASRGAKQHIRANVGKGRQEVYLPITDPEMAPALTVEVGSRQSGLILHELEVRGFPR